MVTAQPGSIGQAENTTYSPSECMRIDDRFGLDVVLRVQRGMSNFPEKEAKKNNETLKTKNPRCVLGKTRYQEPFSVATANAPSGQPPSPHGKTWISGAFPHWRPGATLGTA